MLIRHNHISIGNKAFTSTSQKGKGPHRMIQPLLLNSRGEKTRTSDLHVPNVARCQLCYTPRSFALQR